MSMRNCVKRQSNGARSILFLVFALLLGCSSAFAQGTSSSAVGGTITDQTGGLIKGASVTVTNKANGQTRSGDDLRVRGLGTRHPDGHRQRPAVGPSHDVVGLVVKVVQPDHRQAVCP